MILIPMCRDGRSLPRRRRVLQQPDNAPGFNVIRLSDSCQFTQRRIDAHQVNSAVRDSSRPSDPRHNPDQWHSRFLLPQGELSPVVLFTK